MNYKSFNKQYLGTSDIAALLLAGCDEDGNLKSEFVKFAGDDSYFGRIIDKAELDEIPTHYENVATFHHWMTIYDDNDKIVTIYANVINVYRSGNYGIMIVKES